MGTVTQTKHMADQQQSNRLYRSGAIDFNTEFALRQASINRAQKNANGKRAYEAPTDNDSSSVCEGELLYTPRRHKGNQFSTADASRNPTACLSAVNGIFI